MPTELRTLCNRDCPDACAILATVDDGRVVSLRGDPTHPVTQGFICHRTRTWCLHHHEQRITTPLRRKNGALRAVSWDEALDFAAERLSEIRDQSGPAAILHYRGGGSLGMLVAAASDLFFERFGPVTVKRGDICSGAGEAAQRADFGASESSSLLDLVHARQIFVWGRNLTTSWIHALPVLRRARRAGAQAVLIDPVWHPTARHCDQHLQLRPGGDADLALGVGRLLFERGWTEPSLSRYANGVEAFEQLCRSRPVADWCARADVSLGDAEDLARRLHDGPVTILVGWGMARRANGAAIVRAVDALAAISGNIGIRGAGVSYYCRRSQPFAALAQGAEAAPRTLCEPLLGQQVLEARDPPVRAAWITAANPVAMLPDAKTVARALGSRELLVVADSWLSDTAALADLVLPTPTLLESDDLLGAYGHHFIGASQPVVPPPPGVRSDLQIFEQLAARLDLGELVGSTARRAKERLLAEELRAHGVDLSQLQAGVVKNPLAAEVLFEGRVFPTADGRLQLLDALPPPPPAANARFPLTLLSLSTRDSQASQWGRPPPCPATVTVHPDAAAGVRDGGAGELLSPIGSMPVRVVHDRRQRRDVAIVPKGGQLANRSCANALVRAAVTDLGEGGALYDERVRLQPARIAASTPPPGDAVKV